MLKILQSVHREKRMEFFCLVQFHGNCSWPFFVFTSFALRDEIRTCAYHLYPLFVLLCEQSGGRQKITSGLFWALFLLRCADRLFVFLTGLYLWVLFLRSFFFFCFRVFFSYRTRNGIFTSLSSF